MSYYFYLDKMLLPIPPEKLQVKIKNNNKSMQLIDFSEINVLSAAGLTDISFDILLPNVKYPFATYKDGFKKAYYYLEQLEKLKTNNKPFQFIVTRRKPNNEVLYDTNMKVSLEDYTIYDDVKYGLDNKVSIKLKQYKDYSTKIIKLNTNKNSNDNQNSNQQVIGTQQQNRESTNAPSTKTYTVVKGDSLWKIAKKYYGDGSQYTKIYNTNKDKIKNPNLIYPRTNLNNTIKEEDSYEL